MHKMCVCNYIVSHINCVHLHCIAILYNLRPSETVNCHSFVSAAATSSCSACMSVPTSLPHVHMHTHHVQCTHAHMPHAMYTCTLTTCNVHMHTHHMQCAHAHSPHAMCTCTLTTCNVHMHTHHMQCTHVHSPHAMYTCTLTTGALIVN